MRPARRSSKYVDGVLRSLSHFGHATNGQITDDLRRSYPHLSDTTVHRITQRLSADGIIGVAPHSRDGDMVYDARVSSHDHFRCSRCDELRDIIVPAASRRLVKLAVGRSRVSGPILVAGTCEVCDNDQ